MFCFCDLNLGLHILLIILYNGLKKGFNNLILCIFVCHQTNNLLCSVYHDKEL